MQPEAEAEAEGGWTEMTIGDAAWALEGLILLGLGLAVWRRFRM